MARLLTYGDGRLRTGRVAFLVFAGLLMAMTVLFKLNSSVDQAVLAVKHVFEPAAGEPEERKTSTPPNRAEAETPKREAVSQMKSAARPNHSDQSGQQGEPISRHQAKADVNISEHADTPTAASSDDAQIEGAPLEAAEHEFKTTAPVSSPAETDAVRSETGHQEKPGRSTDTDKDIAVVTKEPATNAPDRSESVRDEVPQPLLDKAGLERLAHIGAEASPTQGNPGPGKIDVSEKLTGAASMPEKSLKHSSDRKAQTARKPPEAGYVKADSKTGEVTVDQQRYMALFKSWQSAGNGGKETEKIPLRVQNLRDAYGLFQMKVIAVVRGDVFLDLSDGTRVAEPSLSEYSTTLFRVDRPWDKWPEALAAAGVRRDERVEVRYYMYDFVKEAIYARAAQAVSWCKAKGLIATDLPASSVDVLGRAYVINRQGGGRFGVFVPVSLDTRDGRTVAIDPVCFRGQADVEALQGAGLL